MGVLEKFKVPILFFEDYGLGFWFFLLHATFHHSSHVELFILRVTFFLLFSNALSLSLLFYVFQTSLFLSLCLLHFCCGGCREQEVEHC
jgi:hypothetical protein